MYNGLGMGRKQYPDDDDDLDLGELEKITRNYKGSVDELEEFIIDNVPMKKKKRKPGKFHDSEG